MYIILPFVGSRNYITTSTFVNFIFSKFPNRKSTDFYFHSIVDKCGMIYETGNTMFDKNKYSVTGIVDNLYFGFKPVEDNTISRIFLDELTSLENVKFENIPWTFTNRFRDECLPFYDKSSSRLLMAKASFKNLDLVKDIADYEFKISTTDSRFRGFFYYNNIEICSEVLLVRPKHE